MSAAASEEEVDGTLTQPPPAALVVSLDRSGGTENGKPATVAIEGEKIRDHAGEATAAGGGEEGGTMKEYYCGCGPWHPPWLQIFRDSRFFTFILCLFSLIEGSLVSGFTSVVLSTLERRYGLSSTATGAIASTFDVAVLVSVVFISYFGGRGHKPRWLGASLIVQATGSFIFALPQFIFGTYPGGSTSDPSPDTCLEVDSGDCTSATNAVLFFFLLGNIFIGIGAAPLFTVGTTYLDEIVHPKHVSVHLGIFYMLAIVGPALGYALGGPFLSIYVDPWRETNLEPSDPGWVGAWWLCFIFCGVVSLLISIPFFFYPRLLPSSAAIKAEREKEMAKRTPSEKHSDDGKGDRVRKPQSKLRGVVVSFFGELKRVMVNPSWIFMTAGIASSILVVSGFASFGPKYVETQFGIPPSFASLIIGAVAIPTGGAGVVVGGLIIYFLKLKGRRVAVMQMIISGVAVFPLLGLLIHCATSDIAGVTTSYPDGTIDLPDTRALNSSCIVNCNCTSSIFQPVCGADDVVYFSACRAGCTNVTDGEYQQCGCIADRLSATNPNSTLSSLLAYNSTATEGLCDRNCGIKLALFLVLIGVALFSVFMLQIPNVLVTIRCVAEDQRTLALGTQSFFWRLFGSIPGPLLFGAIFDSTCLFWQFQCGRRGNCWIYDNKALSTGAVILGVLAMVGYFTCTFFCWLFYPRGGPVEEEKEEEGGGGGKDGMGESSKLNDIGHGKRGEGEEEEEEEQGRGGEGGHSVISTMQNRNSTSKLLEDDAFDDIPTVDGTEI